MPDIRHAATGTPDPAAPQPPPLPSSVQEVAEVIGRDRALFLVGRLTPSGSRSWRRVLYVPHRLHPAHPLVELVGPDDAEKLRAVFGGEILHLAQCRRVLIAWRTRCIAWLDGEGLSGAEIADFLKVSPATVAKTRAGLKHGRDAGRRPRPKPSSTRAATLASLRAQIESIEARGSDRREATARRGRKGERTKSGAGADMVIARR